MPARHDPPPAPATLRWDRALSWAFYDFANTIYSALVVSFAITIHVREFTGVEKYAFLTMFFSMVASGFFLPFAGEICDRTGRAKLLLVVLTLLCCAMCVGMSLAPAAWLILTFFFVANFCYSASLTFYDSLLPTVAPRRRLGFVSGLGVGLGYAGVAFCLPVGLLVKGWYGRTEPLHDLTPIFATAGVLFLAFSLPLFLRVPERPASKPLRPGMRLLPLVFRRVMVTIRALPRHRNVLLFLVGNFLCVDPLNTAIVAYSPYVTRVFGLSKDQALIWMMPFSLCAFGLGALGGKLADRLGPRRTLLSAGLCVLGALVVGALAPSPAVFMPAFILLGGYGLSTIWVSGRKMLVELVPEGQVGKFFGFYNVGHKLAVFGMLTFGLVADLDLPSVSMGGLSLAATGHRLGLLCQVPLLVAGLFCIYRVRMPRREER